MKFGEDIQYGKCLVNPNRLLEDKAMPKVKQMHEARLVKIDEMTSTVRNFHFEFPGQPRFDFLAGQFVMVDVPREEKMVRKPYSIASPPHWSERIELCIKKVEGGYVSSYFFDLKPGYVMPMEAPLGVFRLKDPLPEHLLFVATGTGVAPLRAMIHTLLHEGSQKKISLILGIRYENEILFDAEFRELAAQHPNFEYLPTVSRPKDWNGATGYVQDHIKRLYPHPDGRVVYACGLVPMINSLLKDLTELGYPRQAIRFEKWT
jgi:Flavodoxin reductases (ferredoxin-NADPH reductases) family 1